MALFSFILFINFMGIAQNGVLIGLEGSIKYTSRQTSLVVVGYQGKAAFDVGFSLSKRIKNSPVFWHAGLSYNQFAEQINSTNLNTVIGDFTARRSTKTLTRRSIQIPIGLKIYVSDRSCKLFFHPSFVMDYFFQEEHQTEYHSNNGNGSLRFFATQPLHPTTDYSFSAGLGIGGKQPISDRMHLMLQLDGQYGFYAKSEFEQQKPWSLGIRASVLYELP